VFFRSRLFLDGQLSVNNDGLHGMVQRCADRDMFSGSHAIYIDGFQAGGGVGMVAMYSGPDTGHRLVLMRSSSPQRSSSAIGARLHQGDKNSHSLSVSALPARRGSEGDKDSFQSRNALMHQIRDLTRRLKKQVECQ
jgi:hypothetical protein